MDWKEHLREIRPSFPEDDASDSENENPEAKSAEHQPAIFPDDANQQREASDEIHQTRKEKELEEKQDIEGSKDFKTLIASLSLYKEGTQGFYRVRDLFYRARRGDVKFEVHRWITTKNISPEAQEVVDRLLKTGYISAAKSWHKSAQPEGMKYGTASREERLVQAEEFARKAGLSLSEALTAESLI